MPHLRAADERCQAGGGADEGLPDAATLPGLWLRGRQSPGGGQAPRRCDTAPYGGRGQDRLAQTLGPPTPLPSSDSSQHWVERVCPVCARSAQNRGANPAKRTRHAFTTALRVLASPCRRPCSSSSARRAPGPVKLAASVPRLPPVCKYLLDRASAVDNEGAQTRACCCCTTPTKVLVQDAYNIGV